MDDGPASAYPGRIDTFSSDPGHPRHHRSLNQRSPEGRFLAHHEPIRKPASPPDGLSVPIVPFETSVLSLSLGANWEPFAADLCGRLWTPMELEALRFGLLGRLWTAVDAAWRSTDQKVGGSSPSGRATQTPVIAGASAGVRKGATRRWPCCGSHSREPFCRSTFSPDHRRVRQWT